jgi:hypothetical protein
MDGIDSQRRGRPVEENLRLWAEMQAGSEEGLKNCMRIKMDMQVGAAASGCVGLVQPGRGRRRPALCYRGSGGWQQLVRQLAAWQVWACGWSCTAAQELHSSPDFCGGWPSPVALPPSQGQAQQR